MKRLSGFALAFLTVLTVSAAMPNTVRAEDAPAEASATEPTAAQAESFAKRLFAGKVSNKKSYACFVRRYDAAHLATHPQQKVSVMKMLVTAEVDAETSTPQYAFQLGVNFRHKRGNFNSGGHCGKPISSELAADKLQIGCGVDCDGGGISIEMAKGDNATIVRLERVRLWQNDRPDEEDASSLDGGADDRVFRLERANLEDCRALVSDREELLAVLRK